jgi:hypothetical protein
VTPLGLRLCLLSCGLILAGGCLRGEHCRQDADCGSEAECTRTQECVEAGSALRVVVRWTVNGVAPTPSAPEPCRSIAELEIRFLDPGGDLENYLPVPCPLGRATYDKMPPRFQSVELIAYDRDEDELDSVEEPLAPSGATDVLIDLNP